MSKHTPGPWEHVGQGDICGIENDPENGCVGTVDVCSVYLRTVAGRHEANARLIAAAPRLLAALKDMIQLDLENHQRGADDIDVCQEVMEAYAAIAEAEGTQ